MVWSLQSWAASGTVDTCQVSDVVMSKAFRQLVDVSNNKRHILCESTCRWQSKAPLGPMVAASVFAPSFHFQ